MIREAEKEVQEPPVEIIGARQHNLKNVRVSIPSQALVVITGVSGSGKTSLAFDTLYAEGQRRYVESLSSYLRQFMGKIEKPAVEQIHNLSPAVAIRQKTIVGNPRSTVGTVTEIYDYLKLLFARIGKIYSPHSGRMVKKHTVEDVLEFVFGLPPGTRVMVLAPVVFSSEKVIGHQLKSFLNAGFSRLKIDEEIFRIEEIPSAVIQKAGEVLLLIDRWSVTAEEELKSRAYESIEIAFFESNGTCIIEYETAEGWKRESFSNRLEADGILFEEPDVNFFSFTNPYGACKTCEGFGYVLGIDEDLVIPDKNLSVYEDAVACWRGEKLSEYKHQLLQYAHRFGFPVHTPYKDLSEEHKKLLWEGNAYFTGIHGFFRMVEQNTYKIQYRVLLARYRGKTLCPDCKGTRIRKDAAYVKVGGYSLPEMVQMPAGDLLTCIQQLSLDKTEEKIAERLLYEIITRLGYLKKVGLGYLTLHRSMATLSGGESQRVYLSTVLGSSLTGSIYVLDEPSIGLHCRDTANLITVLKELRDMGNTVVVVEHDEDIIRAADYIIDMGPGAGQQGGEVVYAGACAGLLQAPRSMTADYLAGRRTIRIPQKRRQFRHYVTIEGASAHTLRNINLTIPLQAMVCFSGVSGSGKSTLVVDTLYYGLQKEIWGYSKIKPGHYRKISGDLSHIHQIELIDQEPIGKSSRSNPATYLKAYDDIREIFASQPLAKSRKYTASYFSFNIPGGRCEECKGEGEITIDMQFMADVRLTCEVCKGRKFKEEVLEVTYRGKNIHEVLLMPISEALAFFQAEDKAVNYRLTEKLRALCEVGLGYMPLGQGSSSISGGEAQRIKLASYLVKSQQQQNILFIFDEPTTGLHFYDIDLLMQSFNRLLQQGHTLWIIEHHPDVLKCADWLIELGPGGGNDGGSIVFQGYPEDIVRVKESPTAAFLSYKM